jgi:integrase
VDTRLRGSIGMGRAGRQRRDQRRVPPTQTITVYVADDRLSALWRLLSATGMRRGEVVALRWSDLAGAKLTVGARTSTTAAGKVVHQDDGKSDSAVRTITLDPGTVAALKAQKVAQLEERLHAGPAWSTDDDDQDLMFTLVDGRGLRPDYLSRLFAQLARKAGLPPDGGLHNKLRHTYATLALRAGVPVKVVSERLGHKDINVTLAIYQHVGEADDERAAEATAGFLPG